MNANCRLPLVETVDQKRVRGRGFVNMCLSFSGVFILGLTIFLPFVGVDTSIVPKIGRLFSPASLEAGRQRVIQQAGNFVIEAIHLAKSGAQDKDRASGPSRQSGGVPNHFAVAVPQLSLRQDYAHSSGFQRLQTNGYGLAASSAASLTSWPTASLPGTGRVAGRDGFAGAFKRKSYFGLSDDVDFGSTALRPATPLARPLVPSNACLTEASRLKAIAEVTRLRRVSEPARSEFIADGTQAPPAGKLAQPARKAGRL